MLMIIKRSRGKDGKKHQAILKSATRLFLKNGYSNTSMDAIAEAASVTKQTVYSHYKSKDELFTKMVTHLCVKHAPANPVSKDKHISADEMLFKAGIAFIDMFTNKDVLSATRLVVAESLNHPKLAKAYYESGTLRIIAMIKDFLDSENYRGTLSIKDTNKAASHLLSMMKGTYYTRALLGLTNMPSHEEKEVHIKECVTMFMRIYGGNNPMVS